MSKHHSKKATKSIKEYIYFDNIEVNSILAQFEDGIPQLIEQIKQSTESSANEAGKAASLSGETGVKLGIHASAKAGAEVSNKRSHANSEMVQEAVTTAYDDYAVDVMIKELDNSHLLKTTTKQEDGAFVQLTSSFDLINPNSIGNSMNFEDLNALMSLNQDTSDEEEYDSEEEDTDTENARNGFEAFKHFGNILSGLYPNSILLRTNNCLTIAEKDNFRMNEAQLNTLLLSNRKITIIGKIESAINYNILDTDQLVSEMAADTSKIPSFFPKFGFSLLSLMGLIKKGDRLVKPIAIYFQ